MNNALLKNTSQNTVMEAYKQAPPPWVLQLAKECDETSQAAVARKIKRSPSLINQVLKNKYPGDLKDVQDRIETVTAPTCHICPILGEISGKNCLANQGKSYDPSNHLTVRLFKACMRCPHKIRKGNSNG